MLRNQQTPEATWQPTISIDNLTIRHDEVVVDWRVSIPDQFFGDVSFTDTLEINITGDGIPVPIREQTEFTVSETTDATGELTLTYDSSDFVREPLLTIINLGTPDDLEVDNLQRFITIPRQPWVPTVNITNLETRSDRVKVDWNLSIPDLDPIQDVEFTDTLEVNLTVDPVERVQQTFTVSESQDASGSITLVIDESQQQRNPLLTVLNLGGPDNLFVGQEQRRVIIPPGEGNGNGDIPDEIQGIPIELLVAGGAITAGGVVFFWDDIFG